MRKYRVFIWSIGLAALAIAGGRWVHPQTRSRPAASPTASAPVASAVPTEGASDERAIESANETVTRRFTLYGKSCDVVVGRDEDLTIGGGRRRVWLIESRTEMGRVRVEQLISRNARGAETVLHEDAFVADNVMIQLAVGASEHDAQEAAGKIGGMEVRPIYGTDRWLVHLATAEIDSVPLAMAKARQMTDSVRSCEANGVGCGGGIPNDPLFTLQYGLRNTGQTGGTAGADIHVTAAWDRISASPHVIVAVLDSGIDLNHPDLRDNIYTDPHEIAGNGIDDDGNGFVDDVHGWDFVNNDNQPMDDFGHGTNVAGILGARGNNGVGVAGVTWQVQIMPVKVLNSSNAGTTANLIAALNYARLKGGVKIMNLSLQNYPNNATLAEAITAAEQAGILLAICAGNNGTDNDQYPNYPSSFTNDNIIAVANTTDHDVLLTGTYPSDFGAKSVDLAAPGTSIYNTIPGGYGYFTGTSMSTPLVAGVAALLWELRPDATSAQIRSWILSTVDSVPALAGKCITGGRLNADAAVRAAQNAPVIGANPTSQAAEIGAPVVFGVTAQAAGVYQYQWYKDDQLLAGDTSDTLVLPAAALGDAGNYVVSVSDANGTSFSKAATLTVSPVGASRLINLSVRTTAGTGDNTIIAGFAVAGDAKALLIRGVGPTLARYGITAPLPNPVITLHDSNNVIASDDDWGTAPNAAALLAATITTNAFTFPAGSRDAALYQTLNAGAYTVHCTSADAGQGIALIELYDADTTRPSRVVNLSARSQVTSGAGTLIGGFVVAGSAPKTLLVRGLGPALNAFNVMGALADPTLTVLDKDGTVVAANDNWSGTAELTANFQRAGAFALPANSADAAVLVTVAPGAYTAQIKGVNDTSGVALIEIYDLK